MEVTDKRSLGLCKKHGHRYRVFNFLLLQQISSRQGMDIPLKDGPNQ